MRKCDRCRLLLYQRDHLLDALECEGETTKYDWWTLHCPHLGKRSMDRKWTRFLHVLDTMGLKPPMRQETLNTPGIYDFRVVRAAMIRRVHEINAEILELRLESILDTKWWSGRLSRWLREDPDLRRLKDAMTT